MYTVIGATKTRTLRVLWALEELGQTYDHVPCGPQSEEARRYNPLGKIPALVVDDEVLTDSLAIVTYLADRHGGLTAKAGTTDRARQDAMTQWVVDEMDAVLWAHAKHSRVFPEARREPAVAQAAQAEFARSATVLAERLGDQPFLMGDALTIPDIMASHCLGWSLFAGFDPLPAPLRAYSKRLRTRPAYMAALQE